jgi:glycerol uptake facilitator-like aquaporin
MSTTTCGGRSLRLAGGRCAVTQQSHPPAAQGQQLAGRILRRKVASAVPFAVGAYITAAYWFTASTSFANPAVTIARSATDTFAGIRPNDVPAFLVSQAIGASAATVLFRWMVPSLPDVADHVVVPHDADRVAARQRR